MSVATLSEIPDSFEAGSTVIFTDSFSDYPVSTWTATLCLVKGADSPITVTATTSGQFFLFTLSAALTATIPPGYYEYVIYVTSSGQRTTARTGQITVLQDMSVARAKTSAETMLEGINDAITKLASKVNSTVSFNGQTFTHNDLASLIRSRTYFQAEVIREQRQAAALRGAGDQSRIGVQFVNTGVVNPWQL